MRFFFFIIRTPKRQQQTSEQKKFKKQQMKNKRRVWDLNHFLIHLRGLIRCLTHVKQLQFSLQHLGDAYRHEDDAANIPGADDRSFLLNMMSCAELKNQIFTSRCVLRLTIKKLVATAFWFSLKVYSYHVSSRFSSVIKLCRLMMMMTNLKMWDGQNSSAIIEPQLVPPVLWLIDLNKQFDEEKVSDPSKSPVLVRIQSRDAFYAPSNQTHFFEAQTLIGFDVDVAEGGDLKPFSRS